MATSVNHRQNNEVFFEEKHRNFPVSPTIRTEPGKGAFCQRARTEEPTISVAVEADAFRVK